MLAIHTSDNFNNACNDLFVHSISMCALLVEETVAHFTNNNSFVQCVFLDVTKVFERINYAKFHQFYLDQS
jgi:hypothetical protein